MNSTQIIAVDLDGTVTLTDTLHDTEVMRYVGSVIRLGIGFYVKYQPDKKYVFVNSDSKVLL